MGSLISNAVSEQKQVTKTINDIMSDCDVYIPTPLMTAVWEGDIGAVRRIVNEGEIDVNEQDVALDWSALMYAANAGELEIVKCLVEEGKADIDLQDRNDETALTHSILYKDVFDYLVDAGADIHIQNIHGQNVLMHVAACGYLDLAQRLVNAGAEVRERDDCGRTALMWAAFCPEGGINIVRYLVEEDAEVNARTYDGRTALWFAAKNGYTDIVRYLAEEANANVYFKTHRTRLGALQVAQMHHFETARYLETHMNKLATLSWLAADTRSNTQLAFFSHRLFDRNLIGVVWSFMKVKEH